MDIYVQKDGQQLGPFREARIRLGIDGGEFAPTDLAWTTGKASWQPLSALINLDVTKPPPIPAVVPLQESSVIPVASPPEQNKRCEEVATQSTSVVQPGPADLKSKGPFCNNCGTPYNRWSLFHALGSGLCPKCQKTHLKCEQQPTWDREVKTPQDAYKVMRVTAIYFVVCAIGNFCFGFVWMPIVVLCCTFAMWRFYSRIAATLLIVLVALDFLLIIINALNGAGYFGMALGSMIDSIGLWLSVRSLQAVSKLRTGFIRGS